MTNLNEVINKESCINIDVEIDFAYSTYMNQQVDTFVDGSPIYRYMLGDYFSIVDFAAGYQMAKEKYDN